MTKRETELYDALTILYGLVEKALYQIQGEITIKDGDVLPIFINDYCTVDKVLQKYRREILIGK